MKKQANDTGKKSESVLSDGPSAVHVPMERAVQKKRAAGVSGSALVQHLLNSSRPVQAKAQGAAGSADVHASAARGLTGSAKRLPHHDAIQRSFGEHDVSGISAHVGGPAREACDDMGAMAYATGNSVAFKDSPDLHTAAHEAAHVVQQRAGVSLKGGVGQAGDRYEQHADAVADRVVQGKSASDLLQPFSSGGSSQSGGAGVQRISAVQFEEADGSGGVEVSYDTVAAFLKNGRDIIAEARGEEIAVAVWDDTYQRERVLSKAKGTCGVPGRTSWEEAIQDAATRESILRALSDSARYVAQGLSDAGAAIGGRMRKLRHHWVTRLSNQVVTARNSMTSILHVHIDHHWRATLADIASAGSVGKECDGFNAAMAIAKEKLANVGQIMDALELALEDGEPGLAAQYFDIDVIQYAATTVHTGVGADFFDLCVAEGIIGPWGEAVEAIGECLIHISRAMSILESGGQVIIDLLSTVKTGCKLIIAALVPEIYGPSILRAAAARATVEAVDVAATHVGDGSWEWDELLLDVTGASVRTFVANSVSITSGRCMQAVADVLRSQVNVGRSLVGDVLIDLLQRLANGTVDKLVLGELNEAAKVYAGQPVSDASAEDVLANAIGKTTFQKLILELAKSRMSGVTRR